MVAWKTETNFNNEIQTALIISQDAEMVSVWEALFQQKNCNVVSESSPREAVQTARLLVPSLIVLDLHLPHQELLALCHEIRTTTRGTILLLAPWRNEKEVFDYHKAGVDEHLATPISPMGLLIKSMAWLARQEWIVPPDQPAQIYA